MDRKNLDRYKRILLEKRGEMSVTTAETERPIPAAGGQRGDPVDQANADAEAELQIHLHQTDGRLLRAIEEALGRIRHGTFGTCEACRNPISRARLEAVPWTRLCRDCKERGTFAVNETSCLLRDSLKISRIDVGKSAYHHLSQSAIFEPHLSIDDRSEPPFTSQLVRILRGFFGRILGKQNLPFADSAKDEMRRDVLTFKSGLKRSFEVLSDCLARML